MLKLHILILLSLSLIAFSIQDQNCFQAIETCVDPNIDNCKKSYFKYIEYEEPAVMCDKCENGYYPSTDRKNCIKIETKIDNCVEYDYKTELICAECNSGYALSSDSKGCIKVEMEKLIEHCISYSQTKEGDFICNECIDEYFPSNDNKSCIQIKNCLKSDYYYESPNSEKIIYCYTCKSGFAISLGDGSWKQFDNCEYLEEGNTKCDDCYFPYSPNSNGKCELTFCTEYNDDYQCTKCFNGYYINDDKNVKKLKKKIVWSWL